MSAHPLKKYSIVWYGNSLMAYGFGVFSGASGRPGIAILVEGAGIAEVAKTCFSQILRLHPS
jgi:hypothetical protein